MPTTLAGALGTLLILILATRYLGALLLDTALELRAVYRKWPRPDDRSEDESR